MQSGGAHTSASAPGAWATWAANASTPVDCGAGRVSTPRLPQPSSAAEGTVIQVLQKGYTLGDRVLRPARVVISAGDDG